MGLKIMKLMYFVANDEERNNYQKVLDDNINIIVGVVGMDKIRMFMSNYYDEGKEIVYIDDDIEKLKD
jgi:hypothetical protein